MSFRKGDIVAGYTIEKSLSKQGGMSQVFLAYDSERPTRKVAIKVQLTGTENSNTYKDLLRDEANLLQQLRHPSIVRIIPMRLTTGAAYVAKSPAHTDSPWYYAMEYLPGRGLPEYLKEFSKVKKGMFGGSSKPIYSVDWVVEMFYQLLVTVDFMHKSGIAHCDLKPDNIMFRHKPSPNEVPQPIIIDFGSSTKVEKIRQLTASVGYSPPEVIEALHRNDVAAETFGIQPTKVDVWSLGAILFEMLTGIQLVNQKERERLSTTAIRGDIKLENIRKYRPDVHESMDVLLEVMLRSDPAKRPDIPALIQAIEEKIISVRPPRIDFN